MADPNPDTTSEAAQRRAANVFAKQKRLEQIQAALQSRQISAASARYLFANPNSPVVGGHSNQLSNANTGVGGHSDRAVIRATEPEAAFEFSFRNYGTYNTPSFFGHGAHRLLLPVTPEKFEVQGHNGANTVSTLSGFTFSHAGALALKTISFDSFLPAGLTGLHVDQLPSWVSPKVSNDTTHAREPRDIIALFEAAMDANQPVNFSVTRHGPQGSTKENNIFQEVPVTITNFTWSYTAGQDSDVTYSIGLQRWYPQLVDFKTQPTVYITKGTERRTCVGIAHKFLGSEKRAKEIRTLNAAVLAADHKKRVKLKKTTKPNIRLDLLSAGLKIKIPSK